MAKEAKKPIVYVKPEYSFLNGCACPTCGKEMEQAVYYIAQVAGQYSSSNWQGGRNVKTTTTNYTNIRSKVGGFCPDCWRKARRADTILTALLAGLLVAVAVIGIVFRQKSEGRSIINTVIAGFYALRWLLALLADLMTRASVLGKKPGKDRSEDISRLFVNAYKDAKGEQRICAGNEVLFDYASMRRLQQQNGK